MVSCTIKMEGGPTGSRGRKRMLQTLRRAPTLPLLVSYCWFLRICSGQGDSGPPTLAPQSSPPQTLLPTLQPATLLPTTAISETLVPSPGPSHRPSATPSFMPSISPSRRPSTSPSRSLSPSTNPSETPTTTYKPSMVPSSQPSWRPSLRPSESPSMGPSVSVQPSERPSESPSMRPSVSMQPSVSPSLSLMPSVAPSDSPSEVPSPLPSFSPSLSQAPSVFPSAGPSELPTISLSPSAPPSESQQPSQSQHPSVSPSATPTESMQPSDSPSSVPTPVPTTDFPTAGPSNSPTVTFIQASEFFLEMIFEGINKTWSNRDIRSWTILTSYHVEQFWNTFQFSPVFVGQVDTIYITSDRQERTDFDGRRTQERSVAPSFRVVYNQTIPFLATNTSETPSELANLMAQLFLLPFETDQRPYVEELANATNNGGPIFLRDIFVGVAPTPAPTPSPDTEARNDRNIIIITVVITSLSVCVAGGYIVYLTRKEEQDPLLGPMPSESYDEEDYYRASGLQAPISSVDTEGIHNGRQRAPTTMTGMGTIGTLNTDVSSVSDTRREREDQIAASYPTISTLPISVISGETPADPQFASDPQYGFPSSVQFGPEGGEGLPPVEPQAHEDEGPSPLAMTGFQMEIEDLDD